MRGLTIDRSPSFGAFSATFSHWEKGKALTHHRSTEGHFRFIQERAEFAQDLDILTGGRHGSFSSPTGEDRITRL